MDKPKSITYDNIIIPVDSIADVERPMVPSGAKPHIIVSLKSGRTIDTEFPSEEACEKRFQDFMKLFEPVDWNIVEESTDEPADAAE